MMRNCFVHTPWVCLHVACDEVTLEDEVNAGGKLWDDKAGEATRFAGIAIYVMRECNPVEMAGRMRIIEPDQYKALLHVLAAMRERQLVEVIGAEHCYLHARGRLGAPQFLARMRPKFIIRSDEAWDLIDTSVLAS